MAMSPMSARRRAPRRRRSVQSMSRFSFAEADFWRLLPQIVSAVDDPAADYAMLPTWMLARAAREAGLKVILVGRRR